MQIDPGKISEYALAAALLSKNLIPLWPSSALSKFDIAVFTPQGRAKRIQVKGTSQMSRRIQLRITDHTGKRGQGKSYSPHEVDVVALYVAYLGMFYFIPVIELGKRRYLTVCPLEESCDWKKYRNKWSVFGVA